MRFIRVISFIVLCGVADKAMGGHPIRYYQADTVIYPDNGILTTSKIPIKANQPITYVGDLDVGTLYFTGDLGLRDRNSTVNTSKVGWDDKLDVCKNIGDGYWPDAMQQLIRRTWFPHNSCPVEEGETKLFVESGKTELRLREQTPMLNWYVLNVQVGYSESQVVFKTTYHFEV